MRRVFEHEGRHGSRGDTLGSIAGKLGGSTEALRNWLRQAEVDTGSRDGVTTDECRPISHVPPRPPTP